MPELRSETMTVNMGPQHPSTHGVLNLVVQLSGETIVKADATIGFLHTGIEKTAEPKHAVGARVLRPHVDRHRFGAELRHRPSPPNNPVPRDRR